MSTRKRHEVLNLANQHRWKEREDKDKGGMVGAGMWRMSASVVSEDMNKEEVLGVHLVT